MQHIFSIISFIKCSVNPNTDKEEKDLQLYNPESYESILINKKLSKESEDQIEETNMSFLKNTTDKTTKNAESKDKFYFPSDDSNEDEDESCDYACLQFEFGFFMSDKNFYYSNYFSKYNEILADSHYGEEYKEEIKELDYFLKFYETCLNELTDYYNEAIEYYKKSISDTKNKQRFALGIKEKNSAIESTFEKIDNNDSEYEAAEEQLIEKATEIHFEFGDLYQVQMSYLEDYVDTCSDYLRYLRKTYYIYRNRINELTNEYDLSLNSNQ